MTIEHVILLLSNSASEAKTIIEAPSEDFRFFPELNS
jgi:hypothetical protein